MAAVGWCRRLTGVRGFVSKVPNGEGATAVRVLWKQGRRQVGMEHLGTGRSEEEIALLVSAARERITAGQDVLPGLAEGSASVTGIGEAVAPGARVLDAVSAVLWEALDGVWAELGFEEAVPDKAFKALTLARVIEPTSKLDSARVLAEVGAWAPTNTTIYQCLKRCQERGYRDKLATACWQRAGVNASLLLYDVTTLLCRRRHNNVYADLLIMPMSEVSVLARAVVTG